VRVVRGGGGTAGQQLLSTVLIACRESKRDSSLSWFAERPAPPKAMVSREIMWPRVAVLIAHVKNCQQQDRARRKVEDRQKERIFAPRALLVGSIPR